MVAGSVYLVASRRAGLRSQHRLDSLLSREAAFLLNNLVLVGLCFVIFWGTFFPLISEILSGQKDAVGPDWFNRYTMPLAIVLVFLSGLGPAAAWRRTTPRNARRTYRVPLLASAAVAGYRLRYVRPTASVSPQKVALGAILDVSRHGHHVTTLAPAMGYYPIIDAGLGPIASYFDGNAESAVGLKAGVRRDIWTSVD